jgi:hypothetical protein
MFKDLYGKEIKAGDMVRNINTGEIIEVFADEDENNELAVNVDGTTVYLSEIETEFNLMVVEQNKAIMEGMFYLLIALGVLSLVVIVGMIWLYVALKRAADSLANKILS